MIKRIKKFISVAMTITLFAAGTMGCGSSSSGDNGSSDGGSKEVNVICWSEYLPDEVVANFEQDKGIKVNITTFTDPDEMMTKVQSSAEGTYDMIIGPGNDIEPLNAQGLLQELDKSKIENFKNVDEKYLSATNDPECKYGIPYLGTTLVIAINTDVIKDDIKSYNDLLDTKYKDSMVVVEDSRPMVGSALMANGYKINDVTDEGLAAAKKYLDALKPNIHAFNGDSPKTLLLNGECSLGLIYGGEAALAAQENPAIKVVYPEEGIYFGFDSMMLTKGAKNAENAEELINYILDGEVSSTISKTFPYVNPNKAACDVLGDEFKDNEIVNVPESEIEKSQMVVDLGDDTSKVVNLWTQFKG